MLTQIQCACKKFQKYWNIVLSPMFLMVGITCVVAYLVCQNTLAFWGNQFLTLNCWWSFVNNILIDHIMLRFALETLKRNWPRPGYWDRFVPEKTGPTFFTSMFVSILYFVRYINKTEALNHWGNFTKQIPKLLAPTIYKLITLTLFISWFVVIELEMEKGF